MDHSDNAAHHQLRDLEESYDHEIALDAAVETFDRNGTTIALTFTQPVDPHAIARQLVVKWPTGDVVTTTTPAAPTESPAESTRPNHNQAETLKLK